MYSEYSHVAIRAIATAVPRGILDNEQFANKVSNKKFRRRILYTGVKKRRVVRGDQKASDLVCIAAENLLEQLQWDKKSVNVLIFVTQSPDFCTPSTAMIIQANLGLSADLLAFDVNLGCSGFTSGVQIMAGILSQVKGRGLLLLGDHQNYLPGTEFEENSILFGAGGAAVAMEYDTNASNILAFSMTDGSRANALCITLDHKHIMDGNEIVLFSLNEVVDSINAFHKHYGIRREDVDYYALHQAQKIIVDGVAHNCSLPEDKVLKCYEQYGNTSGASIPFALCANTSAYKKDILSIFGCGFGVGLAWSGLLFQIPKQGILSVIESDHVYPKNI